MTTTQPALITDDDLAQELATARRELTRSLDSIRDFTTIQAERPWLYLEDLLHDLRAAATTVAALERLGARSGR